VAGATSLEDEGLIRIKMMTDLVAATAFAIWIYLLFGRGGFWLCRQSGDGEAGELSAWPSVAAVVPARNEADCIAESIGSLAQQNYPGKFSIVLVDDDSDDNTAAIASTAADQFPAFELVRSRGMAPGWTGKLWALRQGIEAACAAFPPPDYVLLTDADIVHSPDSVRSLVVRAERGGLVLTSLMVKLRCESFAERSHLPAFVYFFDMLYPFSWVNDRDRTTAGAAGGCLLVKSEALVRAGGMESIRGALIDDCALARRMKKVGPIWLGLTERVRSIRRYDWADVKRMIARSAYAQLNYSPLLLGAAMVGLALTFLAAPLLALLGGGFARVLGVATWALMAISFQPMLRFYRVSPLWGAALPAIAAAYMIYTLESAYRYWRGQGGFWKGRVQANVSHS
jgi:hopene-associated glycosyltransferase HpnB